MEEEELSALREVREADPGRRKRKNMRKAKRGRGKKGAGKRKKKGRKGQSVRQSGRQSGRTITADCFEKSLTIMKMWKDVISNFGKQKNRMEKQNETAGKKSGKKSAFGAIAERLVEA